MRHSGNVVVIRPFVAVLRALAAAGAERMTWPRSLFFNVAGGLVWTAAYGMGAYYLGQQIHHLLGPVDIGLFAVTTVLMVVGFIFPRHHARRLEEKADPPPGPLAPVKHRR